MVGSEGVKQNGKKLAVSQSRSHDSTDKGAPRYGVSLAPCLGLVRQLKEGLCVSALWRSKRGGGVSLPV